MSEEEKYIKLQKEYDGNEFFDNMQDCNLALNSLFVLLMEKDFKIVKYNHDNVLIGKFIKDIDIMLGKFMGDHTLEKLREKWVELKI